MTAPALQNVRTREEWAEIINADWRKSIDAIFQTADDLIAAHAELGEREFYEMIRSDLLFSPQVAQRIMRLGRDQRLRSASSTSLPTSWRVLSQLSTLSDDDFEWAQERGLITADTSLRSVDAIKGARRTPEGGTWGRERKASTLPKPEEARTIARETGRGVHASDGHIYFGGTKEQEIEAEQRINLVHDVRDAVKTLATMEMSAADFLQYALPHQLWGVAEEGEIGKAYDWLTDLVAEWGRR